MGKPERFFIGLNAMFIAFTAITVLTSLCSSWMRIGSDRAATVKLTLSAMKVATYNAEGMFRSASTSLSHYCDVDENNSKCVLYKGSNATEALLDLSLALSVLYLVLSGVMYIFKKNDISYIIGYICSVLSVLIAIFLVFAFVAYTSYSQHFVKLGYRRGSGWECLLTAVCLCFGPIIFSAMYVFGA